MDTILVSASQDETRVAVVADGRLAEFFVERPSQESIVGNIYLGRVENVLPGLEAAFVDIGQEKNAFVYIGGYKRAGQNISINQSIILQIEKDAVGTKGPRATLYPSLAGRSLVLLPKTTHIGLSHRLDEEARERLYSLASQIVPPKMGLIIRTAAEGESPEALTADAAYLEKMWRLIVSRSETTKAPALLYRAADLWEQLMRDARVEDTAAIVIDERNAYQRAQKTARHLAPEFLDKISLYEEREPLFARYQMTGEIAALKERRVALPSGGFIVIDPTEAMTVIDVNTGGFQRHTVEATIYRTNAEAAVEILRQLRLRDISGIIIVDFIDMADSCARERLLSILRQGAKKDRQKTTVVDMTSLGLVEITRKKSRRSFLSLAYCPCPYCQGCGLVESDDTLRINIIRELRELERTSHAADGYEITLSEDYFARLNKQGLAKILRRELGIDVILTPASGTVAYSIMRR